MGNQYESQADRDNETRIMNAIQERHGLELLKLPQRYKLDAVGYKGGDLECFFEFKCRTFESSKYPTTFIGLGKIFAARDLILATKAKCWLVIEWSDRVGIINIMDYKKVSGGGRKLQRRLTLRELNLFLSTNMIGNPLNALSDYLALMLISLAKIMWPK